MRKWLFLSGILCFLLLFQVFQDYQEYKGYVSKIDSEFIFDDDSLRELEEYNTELAKVIYRNENRLFPNFWHNWYLRRKLTILPKLQHSDRHQEMISLSYNIYKRTNKPFYLWTYCLLLERIEKPDFSCYQSALLELKKQERYFTRGEYWLIATAVNDPDLSKNKSQLSSNESELMEHFIQNRKQTLKSMFP